MADRIRVQCEECVRKLAVASSAAGRKIRCPGCETMIKIPGRARARPAAATDAAEPDDPYSAPPRRRQKKRPPQSLPPHWSRNPLVGVGVILITLISSGLQTVVQGTPNLRTAEGKGQLAGQLFVLVVGVVAGIVIVIRSLLAKSDRR